MNKIGQDYIVFFLNFELVDKISPRTIFFRFLTDDGRQK